MILSLVAAFLISASPPVYIEADTSSYSDKTRTFLLEGNVVVTRESDADVDSITLRADRIGGVIDGLISAEGDVSVATEGFTAYAESGEYDLATSTGAFTDVSSEYDSWFVSAERIELKGPDWYLAEDCKVTACDENPPHYHFRVSRAQVRNGRISMWGPRFYLGKVPIFWFPYATFVPGWKPPFSVRAGKSGFEGYFVKTKYLFDNRILGTGDLKVDWRSHRGWAYGIENRWTLDDGSIRSDLYRIDERDLRPAGHHGTRGVARVRYGQDYTDRIRAMGEVHYVTDGRFLQDYRFEEFVQFPDPVSGGSITYRGDGGAAMVRAVANANRGDYDLIERLPEVRGFLSPRSLPMGFQVQGHGSFTAFKHSNPYDSATVALRNRQMPNAVHLRSFGRGDVNVLVRRPTPIGAGWMATPYAQLDALGYTEDTFGNGSVGRMMPALGVILSNFYRVNISPRASYSIRPSIDYSERGIHGEQIGRMPIVEHIDQLGNDEKLKIVLDQGLLVRSGGRWTEAIRLRLDGGLDFDRWSRDRYLPIVGKLYAAISNTTSVDASLTWDANRGRMDEARGEVWYNTRKLKANASYYRRRSDPGIPDFENAVGNVDVELGRWWRGLFGASYDIHQRDWDYLRYGFRRQLHDFVVTIEMTDQRLTNRKDFRVNVEMTLPSY